MRSGANARPGSWRTTATTSAQTSTSTSATTNSLMFHQKPRSSAVRLDQMRSHLNSTTRTRAVVPGEEERADGDDRGDETEADDVEQVVAGIFGRRFGRRGAGRRRRAARARRLRTMARVAVRRDDQRRDAEHDLDRQRDLWARGADLERLVERAQPGPGEQRRRRRRRPPRSTRAGDAGLESRHRPALRAGRCDGARGSCAHRV